MGAFPPVKGEHPGRAVAVGRAEEPPASKGVQHVGLRPGTSGMVGQDTVVATTRGASRPRRYGTSQRRTLDGGSRKEHPASSPHEGSDPTKTGGAATPPHT